MSADERLYPLLPAFYRNRDAEAGEPLRALLDVAELQYAAVHQNVQALYDAWFVETCPDWLLPYVADLVGVEGMDDSARIFPATRSAVANAVGYARRRGSAWILARALRDATGWPARAVEPLTAVGSTQALADVRPGRGGTASLRRPLTGTAAAVARTADLRIPLAPRELTGAGTDGRYGSDRMAVYLWRLGSYPVARADAWGAGTQWAFEPGGHDTALFEPPATLPPLTEGPVPVPVPAPLTRDALRLALAAAGRGARAARPPLKVWLNDEVHAVPPDAMAVMDLSAWPPLRDAAAGREGAGPHPIRVAVDPERGRLSVPGGGAARVRVAYAYGFSADVGGGPYDRRETLTSPAAADWTAEVHATAGAATPGVYPTLAAALAAWRSHAATLAARGTPPTGLIRVLDSARYAGDVHLPGFTGQTLAIEAANGERPTIAGDLVMTDLPPGQVRVNGLYVAGRLRVSGTPVVTLTHCTLRTPRPHPAPAPPPAGTAFLAAVAEPAPAQVAHAGATEPPVLTLSLDHCISEGLHFPDTVAHLRLTDSILDGGAGGVALQHSGGRGDGPQSVFERCTVLGRVNAAAVDATDTLFTGGVVVRNRSLGRLVCCYLGPGSRPPATEACQPSPAAPDAHPRFVSTRFGDPGYAQLSTATSPRVRAGATDGSEMGAFASLRNPQREANLRDALDEYMPAGMRAAVLYAT